MYNVCIIIRVLPFCQIIKAFRLVWNGESYLARNVNIVRKKFEEKLAIFFVLYNQVKLVAYMLTKSSPVLF